MTPQWPLVHERDDGIRPAGKPDECFYCRQKVGQPHQLDCVVVDKIVLVRFTIDLPVEVPHHWTADNIEFKYNESSWCSHNLVDMLERHDSCLCDITEAEYVETIDDTPRRKIVEAKAVPSDADGMNGKRAEWARAALEEFMNVTGTDAEDALGELLKNLLHWCDRNNTHFNYTMEQARGGYREEIEAEGET